MSAALPKHDAEELSSLTIAQIKELAEAEGVSITKTKKSDIIAEFLSQQ